MSDKRDRRQEVVARWCAEAFGADHAASPTQRGVRLLEEAIELYQAVGGDRALAHKLLDFVFDRPVGAVAQEIGGTSLCLLALAAACGLSAETEEKREVERVLAKPRDWFTARNKAKNDAGFCALSYPADEAASRPPKEST